MYEVEMPGDMLEKLLKKLHEWAEKSLVDAESKVEERHASFMKLVDDKGEELVKKFGELLQD